MDGKSKKILTFIKKNGGDVEVDDIAFPLKMDEDLVLKLLNELKGQNLVASRTDEKGRVFFSLAEGKPSVDKRANSKEDDDDADFEPKQKAPRIITENEVLDIDDFSPKAAPPPIAPAPLPPIQTYEEHVEDFSPKSAPASAAPAPLPPIQTYEEHVEDFSPKAAPVPAAPPPPAPVQSYEADIEDFSTETAAVAKDETDIEDFAPKAAKKKKKVKEPKIDDDGDSEPKAKSPLPIPKQAIPAACVLLLLIIAFFMGVSSGSGKVKAAIDKASADFVKQDAFDPVVKEKAEKISSMEAEINTLKTSLKNMETELNAVKQAAAARPAPAARPAGRRR